MTAAEPDKPGNRSSALVQAAWRTPGRRVRALAGMDEPTLDCVPSERPQYTALGGVVLGTATVASFSMFLALSEVTGGPSPSLLVPVLIWMLFVLNLDRWLVSSSAGSRWSRRTPVLLPRLVLAMVFGIVIAEPIVLRVFQTAVEEQIREGRAQTISTLESDLRTCNPVPGTNLAADLRAASRACDGKRLDVTDTPTGAAAELAGLRRQAATLQSSIDADEKTMRDLDGLAVDECAGRSGPGLTGVPGTGVECTTRRANAAQYRATHPTADRRTQLTALNARIVPLQASVGTDTKSYEKERTAAIDRRVAEARAAQGRIGLLERFRALNELVGHDVFLHTALWFIRGFLILVDCLPVLVKLCSRTSTYDEMIEDGRKSAERIHRARVQADEQTTVHELQSAARRERERVDLEERLYLADIQRRLDDEVDKLEKHLLRQAAGNGARVNGQHPAVN